MASRRHLEINIPVYLFLIFMLYPKIKFLADEVVPFALLGHILVEAQLKWWHWSAKNYDPKSNRKGSQEHKGRTEHPAQREESSEVELLLSGCLLRRKSYAVPVSVLTPRHQNHLKFGTTSKLLRRRTSGEQSINHGNSTCSHYSLEENSKHFSSQREKEKERPAML